MELDQSRSKALKITVICTGLFTFALPVGAADLSTRIANEQTLAPTIKLPAHLDEDLIYVEGQIGGERGLNLALDTGASVMVISPQLAERLRNAGKLKDMAGERVDTASGKQPNLHFVEVTDVRFGEFVVPRCGAAVLDITMLSKAAGETLDGLAGMALFESVTLVIDFPQKEVRVEMTNTRNTNGIVVVPCDYQGNTPWIGMELAGQRFAAMVDSGANVGFVVPLKGRRFPFVSPPVTVALSANLTDVTEEKEARLATNTVWGGITFERPVVDVTGRDFGIVGRDILTHFVVGFDQRSNLIWLAANTDSHVTSPQVKSLGLSLIPDERGLKVLGVIPNTDASRAGIRRGDYVTAINAEPAKEWSQKRLRALRNKADKFEVDILRKGKTKRVQLKVNVLIE